MNYVNMFTWHGIENFNLVVENARNVNSVWSDTNKKNPAYFVHIRIVIKRS